MANKRAPNRSAAEKIEDAFMDLGLSQQVRMLETLASLHRHAKRMQPAPINKPPAKGKPQTGDEAEAAGRAAHAAAVAEPSELMEKVIDIMGGLGYALDTTKETKQ